jgi:hypothetical protein
MEVARRAKVDPELARRYDERVDSWVHRMSTVLWRGGFERADAASETDVFDADTMAALSRGLIEEAYEKRPYVIVGRGAQCVLQDREEVYHVFVYAPEAARIARLRRRVTPDSHLEDLVRESDRQRFEYVQFHFGCNWRDPHLYHMLICSQPGEDYVVSTILAAIGYPS